MQASTQPLLPSAALAQVALCVCANFRTVSRVITQYYDHVLQPSGLTAAQFSLLAALAANDTFTIKPLADALLMDRTTLSRNLKPLESMGLVEITAGEADARTKTVRLTKQGIQTVERVFPLWQEAQKAVLTQFGEQRWEKLLPELADLAQLIQGE